MRITSNDIVNIVHAYTVELVPMIELAKRYNVTRQAIYKVLRKAGIDTSKRLTPVSCTVCGNEMLRTRPRIRNQKWHFCDHKCYSAWLNAGGRWIEWRQGSRIARSKVSEVFGLQPGHIVHHENKNQYDNRIENLRVFRNQGDHVRYHRGFDVDPLWDGSA